MEENSGKEPLPTESAEEKKGGFAVRFLMDILRGVLIGIAFIIPGFSGGSVAAILGVYEKIVGAIADIGKQFKKSILILLPIAIGMILGVAALLFPLKWAIENFPIPTVCLFVGLAIGGLPTVTEKMKGGNKLCFVSLGVALVAAACLSFLPTAGDVQLFDMGFGGYLLLFLVGAIGSCALVVPGISGSMLLLIFGYYNPLISVITENLLKGVAVGKSILILGVAALGILVGFFAISVLMKFLLKKFPHGTYFAIFGFIVGSVPTVFVATAKDAGLTLATLPSSPWYWIVAVLLLLVGVALSFCLVHFAGKKKEEPTLSEQNETNEE